MARPETDAASACEVQNTNTTGSAVPVKVLRIRLTKKRSGRLKLFTENPFSSRLHSTVKLGTGVHARPPLSSLLLPGGYVRAAIASKSFGCHDLVIHRPQIHAMASPRIHVVGEGDGVVAPLAPVGRTDAPVLRKRSVAQNVRPISGDLVYVVSATIAVHSS